MHLSTSMIFTPVQLSDRGFVFIILRSNQENIMRQKIALLITISLGMLIVTGLLLFFQLGVSNSPGCTRSNRGDRGWTILFTGPATS